MNNIVARTRRWSQTLKEIRDNCLRKLTSEVQAFCTGKKYDEALALLNKSITHPLFNQHRNNAKVIGAFGDTAAVKEIRKQIAIVTAEQNAFHLRNSLSA